MPFVPVPGVAQVNVRATLNGEQIENVFCFQYNAPPIDAGELSTLAEVVRDEWIANVLPLLTQGYTLREVYAVDLTSADGPTATAVAPPGTIGGEISQPLPNNVALVLTHRTAQRGRAYRGRTFISGLVEGNVAGNLVDAGWAGTLVAAFNTFIIEIQSTVAWVFVIVSRQLDNAPRVTGVATVVTATVLRDNVVDSQRRRLPGRGS